MAAANMDKFIYRPETAFEDWPIWIFRFENFLALNEVKYTENEGKVLAAKHLIHAGGDALTKVLKTFEEIDKVTYEQLKTAMSTYCRPKDTRAALYRFTGTRQGPEEALSDYVMRLKPLAYAGGIAKVNSESEILRVIGQHANAVEVKLKCLEADMDTAKLVTWFATIETHQRCLRIDSKSEDVNYVNNNNNA